MAATDLHAVALEFLAACAAALDAETAAGAPARQFVSHGPPAWDCCPMLAVHVGTAQVAATRVGTGALAPGHRIALTGLVQQPTLTATILRCHPYTEDGDPVDPALLTLEAAETNADLWAIRNWIPARVNDGSLFTGGACREVELDTAVALTVEGLCAGWLIPLRLTLDGYLPPDAS